MFYMFRVKGYPELSTTVLFKLLNANFEFSFFSNIIIPFLWFSNSLSFVIPHKLTSPNFEKISASCFSL